MIDRSELTSALKGEVAVLVDDLRVRADEVASVGEVVREQWSAAVDAGRTAHDVETWREGLLAQVAVSWVLGCVFIRFCEDNGLVTSQLLSGPTAEWRRWAADDQTRFFREHPADGERAYLEDVFGRAQQLPGLSEVFGEHNPVWQFGPSDDACRHLIGVFRATDADGVLVWDFTDDSWDTRFLGDLYQDLSEHAKKTFALLQTPDFVESFILDRTLDPAIEEFGLSGPDGGGFRMIDPACGSGHFLLGGFDRLAQRWLERDPAAGRRAAAARALESVFGVDLNPFAASIARFRLLVAALRFAEVRTLAEAPVFAINVAVGDSLLHGPAPGRLQGVLEVDEQQAAASRHLYETEDPERVNRFLGQDYHAVVANPPYITPKDPAANQAYRDRYETCHRQYSLSVPFMERLFDLAARGAGDRRAGFVGQITANSFMKREFGTKLVEEFLSDQVDLTHVIDTSGAYIPGHGTPTVIIFGRNRKPVGAELRALLGVRGEESVPDVPALGEVWSSIVELVDQPGRSSGFVDSTQLERTVLATHPWSLQGGAATELRVVLESDRRQLESASKTIGYSGQTNADAVFIRPKSAWFRAVGSTDVIRPYIGGEEVREWNVSADQAAFFPYTTNRLLEWTELPSPVRREIWPYRTTMWARRTFAKRSYREEGRPWWEWHQIALDRVAPPSLTFSDVATHNHFALDREGALFNRHAPFVKLSEGSSTDGYLHLLGVLNSSVACFWMKEYFYCKGNGGIGGGIKGRVWDRGWEFDGTKLKQFPLVDDSVSAWSKALDLAATDLQSTLDVPVSESGGVSADLMSRSAERVQELRSTLVWLQEELDWRLMYLYGLTENDMSFDPDGAFGLQLGERAFELSMARREMSSADLEWFERHHSSPISELPDRWPDWYRERVEARLALIKSDRFVKLLERPEYKRRWNWEPWEELAADALRAWLLDRLEDARYWPTSDPRSVAQLADTARNDADFVQVAALYRDTTDVDLVDLIGGLVTSDAVPYLAAWRYKDSGLRKRAVWERTWDLQRREDAGENIGKIPVPPKYASSDFRNAKVWRLRGKLDVPKERFVSYPGLERDADPTSVFGWAGWDHLQQAQALAAIYNQRATGEGWDAERLTPILAGLNELVPWLRQWHNDYDPNAGQGLGDYFADYLAAETQRHNLATSDLTSWKAPTATRGRKKKAST